MFELKKMGRYLRVNLLGPGPRLLKKEFTRSRDHKGWECVEKLRPRCWPEEIKICYKISLVQ